MPSRNDRPASKADLAAVDTGLKADIAAVKTELKADIHRLDAKIDGVEKRLDAKMGSLDAKIDSVEKRLDLKIDNVAIELVKTQADVREIKHAIQTRMATKDDIGRIMNAIDGFAGKLETYARESVTLPHIIDEQGKTLETHGATLGEHDRRLKAVESSR